MTISIRCPECKQKLRVPETMAGRAFRCPACKAAISAEAVSGAADDDPESDEADAPARTRPVPKAPSSRVTPAPTRSRHPQVDELEEASEAEEKKPIREKPARKRRPGSKKSSRGLMIGVVVGGVVLGLLVLGGGGGLIWYLMRNKSFAGADWQTFTPPGGECTVLMPPGTPLSKTQTQLDVQVNLYSVERKNGKEAFGIFVYDISPQVLRPNLMMDIANTFRTFTMDRMGGGQATRDRPINLGSLPGLEFQGRLTTKRGVLIGRVFLAKVGNTYRAYLLAVVGESSAPDPGDVARFFDSFKINVPAAPPDLTGAAAIGAMQPPPNFQPPPAIPQPNIPRPNPGRRPPRMPRPPV